LKKANKEGGVGSSKIIPSRTSPRFASYNHSTEGACVVEKNPQSPGNLKKETQTKRASGMKGEHYYNSLTLRLSGDRRGEGRELKEVYRR